MAIRMKKIETMATEAWLADFSTFRTPSSKVAPKVPATMEAKAATTRIRVRYAKMMKRLFALLDIFAEMISPMDFPP